MPFNFRLFFRLTYRSLFESGGTHARLTRKRVVFLLAFYAVFVPWQFVNWMFLVLDNVLFPGYQRVEVREPVFIVGVPRSGSTHFMGVLARDEETFACAKLWEVLLVPSLTQRKAVRAVTRLDRQLGSPIQRRLDAWEERAFGGSDTYHKIRLQEPDEDELNLVPIFSAIHLAFLFPFLDEFVPYVYFDAEVPPAERKRFIAFYRRAMQRTLYLYGPEKRLLSKSPAHSGGVGTLTEAFPDAKFITTVRDPADVLPSTMSLSSYQWQVFSDPLEPYPFRDYMVKMTRHWYEYPLRRLKGLSEDRHAVVEYEDLVEDLEGTVAGIYAELGFDMSPAYARALKEEAEKARQYESNHRYSLEDIGLTEEEIAVEYEGVLERF